MFPSEFRFDENYIQLWSKLQWRDRYETLHMAQQLSCRGMSKVFSDMTLCNGVTFKPILNQYPTNFYHDSKIVREMVFWL